MTRRPDPQAAEERARVAEANVRAARARLELASLRRSKAWYDGAGRGRRTDGWRTRPTGPNAEVRGGLHVLRDRCRDLARNNPWAARGLAALPNNVVGYGISFAFRHGNQTSGRRLRDLARRHLETTACDAGGRHDIYGLQHAVMRTVAESGECLVRRRYRRAADGLPLPYQMQVLEPDHLDTLKEGPADFGGYIVQGVQFDALGRRTGYWLYQEHPGENRLYVRPGSYFVPASDVLHVYREDRRNQVRGVPWLAPCVIALRDFGEYQDAQLVRQKIAASFVAFRRTPEGSEWDPNAHLPPLEKVEPGIIEDLPPGADMTFSSPPGVEGYLDHTKIELRKIAAGLGVPYVTLTDDLSDVNFSSGRLGWLEFQRSLEVWRWHMLIPGFCSPALAWFLEAAEFLVPAATGAEVVHTPPRREMIDPTREVPAKRDEIRAGLITPSEALRERGYEPDAFWAEYEADMKRIRGAEILLDSDPAADKGRAEFAPPAEDQPQPPAKPAPRRKAA